MPFGVVSLMGPRNRILDRRTRWGHPANTIERLCAAAISRSATVDRDAACSQITLWAMLFSVCSQTLSSIEFTPRDV